jgi:predicted lipid-binding transport protein (Tim44 family)
MFGVFFDIILFAVFAVYIFYRLFNAFGTHDEEDQKRQQKKRQEQGGRYPLPGSKATDVSYSDVTPPVAVISPLTQKDIPSSAAEVVKAVHAGWSSFSDAMFLESAKKAYEMVFEAYTKADTATLKMLLNDEVYQQFSANIEARKAQETIVESTLVAMVSAKLTGGRIEKQLAYLSVAFVTEQILIERDKAGKISAGDPSNVAEVHDTWTFSRALRSQDPAWVLVSTSPTETQSSETNTSETQA